MVTRVRLDTQRLLAGFVIILFLCWSGAFIWKSSIPLNSGGRAFCLFDDAMVSMRYAENLVKGHGPVWNPGERVEGYTNPLMVAVMAATLAVFEKPTAVLTIQILGVLMVIGTALLTLRAHRLISGERYRLPSWLFLFLVFSIYTMSFWSLMGMETGLVALFLAFGVNVVLTKNVLPHDRVGGDTIPLVLTAAGLYFSRPDALALAAVLFFLYWVSPPRPSLSRVLIPVLCVILIVVVHVALRFLFYGELLPNTAVLKLGGFPLPRRILGGTGFVLPFIEDIYPMVALAALSCALKRDWNRVLLLSLFGVAVGYQIYVGGDPWAYWRIMTPTIPLLFVLAADGAARVASAIFESQASRFVVPVATLLILGGALHSYNKPFMREMCLLISPFSVEANKVNVNIAFALKDITKSSASVGVLWAGSIPFYSERYAVDFLGKCDPAIAALRPELKGGVQWSGMPTVPGHNKYDLVESIVRRRPTYIQTVSWSSDDVSEWASLNYLKITHMGSELLLLRDSPDVYWGRVIETQNVR